MSEANKQDFSRYHSKEWIFLNPVRQQQRICVLGVTNAAARIFQPTKKFVDEQLPAQWNDWPPGRPVCVDWSSLWADSRPASVWVDQLALSAPKHKPKGRFAGTSTVLPYQTAIAHTSAKFNRTRAADHVTLSVAWGRFL
jgi:hypothetical protein